MRNIINIFNNLKTRNFWGEIYRKIFSSKFIVSTLFTILFASGLRWFYSVILSLDISITEFDLTNVSFCSLVLLFKKEHVMTSIMIESMLVLNQKKTSHHPL